MKSLEVENQTLHKGLFAVEHIGCFFLYKRKCSVFHLYLCWTVVETLRETLQKLEVRVAVLERSPAPTAVPCTKVEHNPRAESVHCLTSTLLANFFFSH